MDGVERTNTFEARMQDALALEPDVHANLQSGIAAVNAAQDDFEEEFRRAVSDDRREAAQRRQEEADKRWLLQPSYQFSEDNVELAYVADQLLETTGALVDDDFVAAAILGRKVHHNTLYYKVAWRGRNCVTWEHEDAIENKAMVAAFERQFLSKAMMPRTTRLRPPVYISRRIRALDPVLRERLEEVRKSQGGTVTWSCEVEPFIWIPYDEEEQGNIEASYARGSDFHVVHVNGSRYKLLFREMVQLRYDNAANNNNNSINNNGPRRTIRRFVQLAPEEEHRLMAAMSTDELRQYIASLPEILPVHYEALQRFHDADKVQHRVSTADLAATLFVDTFADVMNHVVEGRSYPCFSSECFVCLEDYVGTDQLAHLICGHFFHKDCAFQYFERYSRLCPICKEDVL